MLDSNDLVRCSAVNKLWRHEALTVMRDWKRFLAPVEMTNKVRRSKIACKDLKDLNDMVAGMSIVPFRGLSIVIVENDHGPAICPAVENISEYYGEILSRITMSSVQIGWYKVDGNSREEERRSFLCPAIQLLLKIMKEHCHKIMSLAIDALPMSAQLFTSEDLQSGAVLLSNLRRLVISDLSNNFLPNLLEDLIAISPKLDFVDVPLNDNQIEKLPTSIYSSLKQLTVRMFKAKFEDFYYNFALVQPRLVNLKVLAPDKVGRINFQKWIEALKLIFQSSSPSLCQLLIDSYTLSLLMKYQVCIRPLENLNYLEIATGIDPGRWVSPTREIISKLNFSSLFPKVTKVTVFATYPDSVLPPEIVDPFEMEEEIFQADDADVSTEHIKGLVIKETSANGRFIRNPILQDRTFLGTAYQYWAQLFPHISSLTVSSTNRCKVPYNIVWMNWQKLEELNLNLFLIETEDDRQNYDAAFCGLHPEEVRLLRSESVEFLEKVNLVTMPSILHLRSKPEDSLCLMLEFILII